MISAQKQRWRIVKNSATSNTIIKKKRSDESGRDKRCERTISEYGPAKIYYGRQRR